MVLYPSSKRRIINHGQNKEDSPHQPIFKFLITSYLKVPDLLESLCYIVMTGVMTRRKNRFIEE
ncbi:MAG: hypothetical protein ACW99Q_05535, partial [Candidatus Kariarchaeaceae archaeon]|jgi:hypothetical protein